MADDNRWRNERWREGDQPSGGRNFYDYDEERDLQYRRRRDDPRGEWGDFHGLADRDFGRGEDYRGEDRDFGRRDFRRRSYGGGYAGSEDFQGGNRWGRGGRDEYGAGGYGPGQGVYRGHSQRQYSGEPYGGGEIGTGGAGRYGDASDWAARASGYDENRVYGLGYGYDYGAPRYPAYGPREYDGPAWRRHNREGRFRNEDRGFWDRASDEVASWFGDDEAERRRRLDARYAGRGPRDYRRSDGRILEDVNDRLTDDPFVDASDIKVRVENCEVTMDGTVENRMTRRRVEDLAEQVSGVTHVQNNVRVRQRDQESQAIGSTGSNTGTGAKRTTSTDPGPVGAGNTEIGNRSSLADDAASGGTAGKSATTTR